MALTCLSEESVLSPLRREELVVQVKEEEVFDVFLELGAFSEVGADAGLTADKLIAPVPPVEQSCPLSDSLTSE